ncbi:MAG: SidA/IucD/PvdA family monooxygenase, partial [Alphaproteobacteria bacterium]|nr:SidA/IucD/PvdA family monooxygenase [Alphaproteobacteria bacterium]
MDRVCDIIGIGFGPANLSLAIALQERAEESGNRLETVFLEQKSAFGWFPEMLIPGATMQVSFLKDLVSLRNPCSPYG